MAHRNIELNNQFFKLIDYNPCCFRKKRIPCSRAYLQRVGSRVQLHGNGGVVFSAKTRYNAEKKIIAYGERSQEIRAAYQEQINLITEGKRIYVDESGVNTRQKVNLLFLPQYSPDYNPIEHSWANMKRFLRSNAVA